MIRTTQMAAGVTAIILLLPFVLYCQCPTLAGTLTGSNTCNNAPGLLTFHSQSGAGPFTLVYSDGTQNYTQTNVMDGLPFKVILQPTASTTYTLVSIQAAGCPATMVAAGITAIINPGNCTLCTGNLGDPILDATFGSGNGNSPPLPIVVPGASTNLMYVPVSGNPAMPTPLDGQYTITSTVPNNSSGAYWYTGGTDHTGDPNGYMLYENPGTSIGEFFRDTLTTLCGGGKYQFSAWIANSDNIATVPNPVLPDLTFIVQTEDGTVMDTYNSGPVPELPSWTWNHYGFYFTLPSGVTTAILRIIDNNPGGANVTGNDFAMDDITFSPCGPVMVAALSAGSPTVCPGNQATFTCTVDGGYTNPAYLWQVSADSGTTWTDLPAATTTQLTVTAPAVTTTISYYYRMLAAEAENIQSPSCRVTSNAVTLTVNAIPGTDFSLAQLPCNPLQVQFTGTSSAGATYTWNIAGTDQAPANQTNPTLLYTFPGYANYSITLSNTALCPGSTTKNITIANVPADILQTTDTTICVGKSVPLRSTVGLNFCWSPAAGLNNTEPLTATASPAVTTQYHYTSLIPTANLVVNGDFSTGNTGFTSGYSYSGNGSAAAVYFVGPNPGSWLPGAAACTDHTSGTGNMLLVNGAEQPNVNVWSQTVAVQPNTNYAFLAWLDNITTVSPAILHLAINGQELGSTLTANVNECTWNQLYIVWNSGAATSAVLSIIDDDTAFSGNDFALDDIFFAPATMQTDSVTINVETPAVTVTPATSTVCPGIPLQLQASGSLDYSWSPVTGLNNTSIANPISLLPASTAGATTIYTVTGTSARGCTASATVTVTQFPQLLTLGPPDTIICKGAGAQLYASGGVTYSWTPTGSLDNPASATPVATPTASTQFYLSVTDANQCLEQDSLMVNIRPAPLFKAPPDELVCQGFNVKLISENGPGYIYSWTPATGLDNPSSPSPDAGPNSTTTYVLNISDSVCATYDSSFALQVRVQPSPIITAKKGNDIDCAIHTAQLHASGALYYAWSPASALNDANSADPIASIDNTTTFVIKGTDSNGCYSYDSLIVDVTTAGANTFIVPNAFTPNGDGHNDCFGVTQWGDVQLEELTIYNRWGVKVFSTRNPSDCWDGTFRGQPQPAGAYPYTIKARTFCGEIARTGLVFLIR